MFLIAPAAGTIGSTSTSAPRSRLDLAIVAACATAAIAIGVRQLARIDVRSPIAPEPAAARYVLDHHLHGRMLTWFGWGEYAIWHLAPEIKVSIDGRRETAYSDALVSDHIDFYRGGDRASRYPDQIGADYIWLPKVLAVVPALEASGWRAVFTGPESVILARAALPIQASAAAAPVRQFPGP
jgi:hypothetical protein